MFCEWRIRACCLFFSLEWEREAAVLLLVGTWVGRCVGLGVHGEHSLSRHFSSEQVRIHQITPHRRSAGGHCLRTLGAALEASIQGTGGAEGCVGVLASKGPPSSEARHSCLCSRYIPRVWVWNPASPCSGAYGNSSVFSCGTTCPVQLVELWDTLDCAFFWYWVKALQNFCPKM